MIKSSTGDLGFPNEAVLGKNLIVKQLIWGSVNDLPVLGEYIYSRRMICTVSQIHGFKMRHEVQQTTSYFVLVFWKSVGKTGETQNEKQETGEKGR